MNPIRQGDVSLRPVSGLPKGAKKEKDKTLAYGEVTGHSHRFADTSLVETFKAQDGLRYLKIKSPIPIKDLLHEEHTKWQRFVLATSTWEPTNVKILPGIYEIKIEREYDYAEESMKQVMD